MSGLKGNEGKVGLEVQKGKVMGSNVQNYF